MLVITRYEVADDDLEQFRELAASAVEALSERAGCQQVRFGRNVDEPLLWVLASSWRTVGDYRRALSHPEVKVRAVPLMYRCIDEPSAYEDLLGWDPVAGTVTQVSDLA
jgi:quinol monooxygenase YgiN